MVNEAEDQSEDGPVSIETSGGRVPQPGDFATPKQAHDRIAPAVRKLRRGDDIPQRDVTQPDV